MHRCIHTHGRMHACVYSTHSHTTRIAHTSHHKNVYGWVGMDWLAWCLPMYTFMHVCVVLCVYVHLGLYVSDACLCVCVSLSFPPSSSSYFPRLLPAPLNSVSSSCPLFPMPACICMYVPMCVYVCVCFCVDMFSIKFSVVCGA